MMIGVEWLSWLTFGLMGMCTPLECCQMTLSLISYELINGDYNSFLSARMGHNWSSLMTGTYSHLRASPG